MSNNNDNGPMGVGPADDGPEENEVLRAARMAKESRERANDAVSDAKEDRKIGWKTAAAAGLGSAAIIAALLYARRDKDS